MEFSGASRLQSCKICDFSKDQHNPKLKKRMSLKDIGYIMDRDFRIDLGIESN